VPRGLAQPVCERLATPRGLRTRYSSVTARRPSAGSSTAQVTRPRSSSARAVTCVISSATLSSRNASGAPIWTSTCSTSEIGMRSVTTISRRTAPRFDTRTATFVVCTFQPPSRPASSRSRVSVRWTRRSASGPKPR